VAEVPMVQTQGHFQWIEQAAFVFLSLLVAFRTWLSTAAMPQTWLMHI
jgi:hypothetical protein